MFEPENIYYVFVYFPHSHLKFHSFSKGKTGVVFLSICWLHTFHSHYNSTYLVLLCH